MTHQVYVSDDRTQQLLARLADAEETLRAIRDGEVDGDRCRAQRGHRNAQPEAWRHAEVIGMHFDVFFDGTEVAEGDAANHIVGRERKHVLDGVQPLELTADVHLLHDRADAAEVEAA